MPSFSVNRGADVFLELFTKKKEKKKKREIFGPWRLPNWWSTASEATCGQSMGVCMRAHYVWASCSSSSPCLPRWYLAKSFLVTSPITCRRWQTKEKNNKTNQDNHHSKINVKWGEIQPSKNPLHWNINTSSYPVHIICHHQVSQS